jgi:hypothetical protein
VSVSFEPAANVALIVVDWPTRMLVEPAEMVAVAGCATVRDAEQELVPPAPETEPV